MRVAESTTKTLLLAVLAVATAVSPCLSASHSIVSFGAVAGDSSTEVAFNNSRAIESALAAASPDDVVVVPAGDPFYVSATSAAGMRDVTLRLEGQLLASDDIAAWPNKTATEAQDVLTIANSTGFTIDGGGGIDGQGYNWWWAAILKKIPNVNGGRPHLVHFQQVDGVTVRDVTLSNSAQFHCKVDDVANLLVVNTSVLVDLDGQRSLHRAHGTWDERLRIPTFPLNTDGFDLRGRDMTLHNLTIRNFDDAVVPKPQHTGGGVYSNCTERIHAYDISTEFTVGMSIGSVPPHTGCNCIRDVVFEDIRMFLALKSIYVKTNPGDEGTGLVQNITFTNFTVTDPVWFAPYIGPQQMSSSYGGPGCLLWPLVPGCQTNPRITIKDILLKDIAVTGKSLFGATIRGNVSNPITGIVLDNVQQQQPFLACENAEVKAVGGTSPVPSCKTTH